MYQLGIFLSRLRLVKRELFKFLGLFLFEKEKPLKKIQTFWI